MTERRNGPPERVKGPDADPNPSTPMPLPRRRSSSDGSAVGRQTGARRAASQQVSWWSVHEYVQPMLDVACEWPMVGSPAWCQLADDDPAKLAALCDAAQHWALRVETCQQASAEASRDIAAAADWKAIASEIQQRRGTYIPRTGVA